MKEIEEIIRYVLTFFSSEHPCNYEKLLEHSFEKYNRNYPDHQYTKTTFQRYFSSTLKKMLEDDYSSIRKIDRKKEYYLETLAINKKDFFTLFDVLMKVPLLEETKFEILSESAEFFDVVDKQFVNFTSLGTSKKLNIDLIQKVHAISMESYEKKNLYFYYNKKSYAISPYFTFYYNKRYYLLGYDINNKKLQHFDIENMNNKKQSRITDYVGQEILAIECKETRPEILRNVSIKLYSFLSKHDCLTSIHSKSKEEIEEMSQEEINEVVMRELEISDLNEAINKVTYINKNEPGNKKDLEFLFFTWIKCRSKFKLDTAPDYKSCMKKRAEEFLPILQINYEISNYLEKNLLNIVPIKFKVRNQRVLSQDGDEVEIREFLKQKFGDDIVFDKKYGAKDSNKILKYGCFVKWNKDDFINWAILHYDILDFSLDNESLYSFHANESEKEKQEQKIQEEIENAIHHRLEELLSKYNDNKSNRPYC